ncbi:MAG: glycosyltransferase [Mucilaginibacter sp.]
MANTNPLNFKVTIITVVKNADKVILRLFNSVRKCKTADVEFMVLDGLSTDGTIDLIKKNLDIIDIWKSEADTGIYDAMNKAVKMAHGKWLIFMGADDELLEGFEQIISLLSDHDAVYYGKVFFHNTIVTGKIENDYRLTKTNICHQAIFYPKSVFKKYSYETEYIKCADYVLNLKLWGDDDFKFIYCDYLIANFPQGGFSTHTADVAFDTNRDNLFKKYLSPTAYYRHLYRTTGAFNTLLRFILNK